MLRSVLRERSNRFFDILKYDKSDWFKFWREYCEENNEFMSGYAAVTAIDDENAKEILNTMSRPFLDKINRKNQTIKHLKRKTAREIHRRQKELGLSDADFTVYIIGALGIRDVITIARDNETVILIDIVSLYNNNRIGKLEETILNSILEVKKAGGIEVEY